MSISEDKDDGIQRIPHQFHRIWLGGPMPDEFRRFGDTWLEQHPGWTMRQWGDDNLPPMRNQTLFDAIESASQKSDILRFELLWLYGGVYVDTDFECRQSIEPLLEGVQVFAAREIDSQVSGAIVGSVPEHPFIGMLIDSLPGSLGEHGRATPAYSTGPGFVSRCLKIWDSEGKEPVTIFPASYFYPYLWYEKQKRFAKFPDAYAVHHWANSWQDPTGSWFTRRAEPWLMRYWITRRFLSSKFWVRASSFRRR
jgi:mannosyltransferase OCH1-like enzyme